MPRTRSVAEVEGRSLREWDNLLHDEYDRCLSTARFYGLRGNFRSQDHFYENLTLNLVRWRADRVRLIRSWLERHGFSGSDLPTPSVLDTLPEILRSRTSEIEVLNGTTALTPVAPDSGLAALPDNLSDLTFGVEFEVILPPGSDRNGLVRVLNEAGILAEVESYNHTTRDFWKLVTDGSLRGHGYELVSPILSGQEGIDRMRAVCAVLVGFGCIINRSCGFHVHVGMQNMADVLPVARRIVGLYATSEEVLDTLVSPSRRGRANPYCRSTAVSVRYHGNILGVSTMEDLRRVFGTRYMKVNVEAFWRHGTIEFRHHQGTVDAEKATAWVKLCLKIVDWARGSDTLPSEIGTLRSLSEMVKLTPVEVDYFTRRAARLSTIRTAERR